MNSRQSLQLDRFNQTWRLGHDQELRLIFWPPSLEHFATEKSMFDELLVKRHYARQSQNWSLSDAMRDFAELRYARTIVDTPREVEHGGHDYQYFAPIRAISWYRKWRPFLTTLSSHVDLDDYAKRGPYGRYGPGWLTMPTF